MFSLFCQYIRLEYVRIHAIYSVSQAEYGIHILVVAPQDVNLYSTRRVLHRVFPLLGRPTPTLKD